LGSPAALHPRLDHERSGAIMPRWGTGCDQIKQLIRDLLDRDDWCLDQGRIAAAAESTSSERVHLSVECLARLNVFGGVVESHRADPALTSTGTTSRPLYDGRRSGFNEVSV